MVKVECEECYNTMATSDYLTCLPGLYWDRDIPDCQCGYLDIFEWQFTFCLLVHPVRFVVVYCPGLDAPANGTKTGNETACGSVVSFTCDAGLELRGPLKRTCMTDGSWSGDETICDG